MEPLQTPLLGQLAQELGQPLPYITNVVALLDEGNTIPFIARYRKELHGGMDDTLLRQLFTRLQGLRNLELRKEEVKTTIAERGGLTEELTVAIDQAKTLSEVEDLYRPFKQKRRTRATMAREKGLTPLAQLLFAQKRDCPPPEVAALPYLNEELGVTTVEEALAGANDIIAEELSDNPTLRKLLRDLWWKGGYLVSVAAQKEPEDSVYRLYYAFKAPLSRAQGYQVLAINRGEREEVLKVTVEMDEEKALIPLRRRVLAPTAPSMEFVRSAIQDSYQRLIAPSLTREMRNTLTEQANEGAIAGFGLNLKPLLMQPPVKGQVTMALDPGYRNGCKVAVVDGTGKVLDTAVVYPALSQTKKQEAIVALSALVKKHKVVHLAIGNGTASRETEQMAAEMIGKLGGNLSYAMVNEAGASVYSASQLAADEFPQYDVNIRSAISIARRLQDPLAELVKIDPKSIGVGQYQHDMPQGRLDETLSGVVEDCVNRVGVDLNTASAPLLTRVAGLNKTTAQNIVTYREENGIFTARGQLLKVPKVGKKAYQQCAGFLRVPESTSILDNTGVHPESYKAATALLTQMEYTLDHVKSGDLGQLKDRIKEQGEEQVAQTLDLGVPTLRDIVDELLKPARDPREDLPAPILRTDVLDMSHLKAGMELLGTVRNVIDFGAFVDIGVHQDGLIHISQLSKRRVKHPSELLSVGDTVTVWVLEVDQKKKRIGLTCLPPV